MPRPPEKCPFSPLVSSREKACAPYVIPRESARPSGLTLRESAPTASSRTTSARAERRARLPVRDPLALCRSPAPQGFPLGGNLPLLSPLLRLSHKNLKIFVGALFKGRWIAEGKTEGLSCTRGSDHYNPPASLRSAPSLTQGGQGIWVGGDDLGAGGRGSMSFRNEAQPIEESPRSPSLTRGSLHFTTFRVRDDRMKRPPCAKGAVTK